MTGASDMFTHSTYKEIVLAAILTVACFHISDVNAQCCNTELHFGVLTDPAHSGKINNDRATRNNTPKWDNDRDWGLSPRLINPNPPKHFSNKHR